MGLEVGAEFDAGRAVGLAEAVELALDEVEGIAGEHEWVALVLAAGEAVAPLTGDLVPEPLLGLTKLRTDPARATALLRALLVLTNLEASR